MKVKKFNTLFYYALNSLFFLAGQKCILTLIILDITKT